MTDGRVRTRAAIQQLLPVEHTRTPLLVVDQLGRELDDYAELIVGPGARPVGFMTHGDGPQFTERVRVSLELLDLSDAASAAHQAMARHFEHQRGFAKFEWHVTDDGGVEPLAAIYFRRRPKVSEVLPLLARAGVSPDGPDRVAAIATALDKDAVHFVAAAFRPGQPVHHKLYFALWFTAETRAAMTARLQRVFELYDFDRAAVDRWRSVHDRCVAEGEPTVFVSMSCSAAGVSPSFKIDYADLRPALASTWLAPERRPEAELEMRRVQALAGCKYVTFLGVRFARDRPEPTLKYYVDVPGSR